MEMDRKLLLVSFSLAAVLALAWGPASASPDDGSPAIEISRAGDRVEAADADAADRGLILQVFPNGHVKYSDESIAGGPPFKSVQIDPRRVQMLLRALEADGLRDDPAMRRAWYGPDASYTTIDVRSEKVSLTLRSWHEQCEQNPRCIAGAFGLAGADGRSRAEVLEEQTPEYQRFRRIWDIVRRVTASWVPAEKWLPEPVPTEALQAETAPDREPSQEPDQRY